MTIFFFVLFVATSVLDQAYRFRLDMVNVSSNPDGSFQQSKQAFPSVAWRNLSRIDQHDDQDQHDDLPPEAHAMVQLEDISEGLENETEGFTIDDLVKMLDFSYDSPYWSVMADYYAETMFQNYESLLRNAHASKNSSSAMQLWAEVASAGNSSTTSYVRLQDMLNLTEVAALEEEGSLVNIALLRALGRRGLTNASQTPKPKDTKEPEEKGDAKSFSKFEKFGTAMKGGVERIVNDLKKSASAFAIFWTHNIRWEIQVNLFGGFVGFPQLAWKCQPLQKCVLTIIECGVNFVKPIFRLAGWLVKTAVKMLVNMYKKLSSVVKGIGNLLGLRTKGASKMQTDFRTDKDQQVQRVNPSQRLEDMYKQAVASGIAPKFQTGKLGKKEMEKLEKNGGAGDEQAAGQREHVVGLKDVKLDGLEDNGQVTISAMDRAEREAELKEAANLTIQEIYEEKQDIVTAAHPCDACGRIKGLFDITPASIPLAMATGGLWLFTLFKVWITTTPQTGGKLWKMLKDCFRVQEGKTSCVKTLWEGFKKFMWSAGTSVIKGFQNFGRKFNKSKDYFDMVKRHVVDPKTKDMKYVMIFDDVIRWMNQHDNPVISSGEQALWTVDGVILGVKSGLFTFPKSLEARMGPLLDDQEAFASCTLSFVEFDEWVEINRGKWSRFLFGNQAQPKFKEVD